ncbi:MAG: glutamate formimidoyltransferase [candidate division WOR-3 bacterium]|jgi:glutamate formiminotransferase/formiminotetrahydrofolate cyclodeaminase
MRRIVECVPNFSEGRRPEVIEQIVNSIKSVTGVTLLDQEMNADHNRAVISFVGEPEAVLEAAFRATRTAAELIDLTKHQGEHPRIGATDVIPFVPISGVTQAECIELAKRLGKRIADELGIPVYLYELAATRPDRQDLANIRQGEFEGLREAVKTDPDRAPDFGRPELHPTAGATVVGVRAPLIAYNINLSTPDVKIAERIARAIRFRSGGYRYVKALGFELKEKNCAQVSINMTDYTKTPLYRVFETVKREAQRYGVQVVESEIVGLVPQAALVDCAKFYLQLNEFKKEQILENRLMPAQGLPDFLNELASSAPVPGGGTAAALNGAIGTALFTKVANLTIGKKGYEEFEEEISGVKEKLIPRRERFISLMEEDAESFQVVMQAYKLPKMTELERQERERAISEGLKKAAAVPLQTMRLALEVMKIARPVVEYGNKSSISDAGVATINLDAAFRGARLNVLINLGGIKEREFVSGMQETVDELAGEMDGLVQEYLKIVSRRMA